MLQLHRDQLLTAYRQMRLIREFEDGVHVEFSNGAIPGFVHLYAGEEASAVGVCLHLREDVDHIASTHRGHGHCIAKGCDVDGMMLEIFGKDGGLCNGKGGSMHIADLNRGMLGANGIVGGGPPLVCGAALTAKTLGTRNVAVAFTGDGASNQGTTFEAMNLATVWKLPAIFIFENNGYAEATSSKFSVSCGDIANRAVGFGAAFALATESSISASTSLSMASSSACASIPAAVTLLAKSFRQSRLSRSFLTSSGAR